MCYQINKNASRPKNVIYLYFTYLLVPQSPDSLKLRSSLLSPSSPLHPMARHVLSDTTVLGKDFESLAKAQVGIL